MEEINILVHLHTAKSILEEAIASYSSQDNLQMLCDIFQDWNILKQGHLVARYAKFRSLFKEWKPQMSLSINNVRHLLLFALLCNHISVQLGHTYHLDKLALL